jgi:hypothetical protein
VAVDADELEGPACLPKTEAGRLERASECFQPGLTEATVSASESMTTLNTVAEAGMRNACEV